MKGVASMNKSKKKKNKKKREESNTTFPINTLNLKVKVPFSRILPPDLNIIRGPFT